MDALNRRALLRRLGAVSAGLVAGCNAAPDAASRSPSPGTGRSTTASPGTPTSTATPEQTSTATETPTPAFSGNPGPLPEATWPLTYRGMTNASYLPDGPGFERKPIVDWTVQEPVEDDPEYFDPRLTPPVIADGRIYTTKRLTYGPEQSPPDQHYLMAYATTSGETRWKQPIRKGSSARFPTAPAIQGNTVFVGHDRILRAHDTAAGEEAWRRDLEGPIAAIFPTPDRTYVRTHRSVVAVGEDGTVHWTDDRSDFPGALALGTRNLYVGASRRLVALNPETGEVRWKRTLPATGGYGITRLVTVDGGVFALQNSGDLYTFDADGKPVWNPDGSYGAISTDGGRLYATVQEAGTLRTFDIATGRRLWELACTDVDGCDSAVHVGKPVVTGDAVYVPMDGGHLVAVRPADGSVRWRLDMARRVPVITLGENAMYSVGDYEESITRLSASETDGQ